MAIQQLFVYTYCCEMRNGGHAFGKSEKNASLANTRISNDD